MAIRKQRLSTVGVFLIGSLLSASVLAQSADDDFDALFGDESSAQELVPSNPPPEASVTQPVAPAPTQKPDIVLTAEEPPARSSAPPRRAIEEIVVTAQKTEQSLMDVPVSVSAVSAEALRQAGIFGPEGIENQVPNLEMNMDPQAPSIGIRGFSTDSFNVGLEPSVGIIIDEVSIGRTEFIPDGLFDMRGIEVLRGPQGTLFGKNTIAGVLILSTAQPQDEFGGQLLFTGWDDAAWRVEGGVSLPLTDAILSRVGFTAWRDDGEVENSFLNREELSIDQMAGRVRLDIAATDALQIKLGAQLSTTEHNYPGWQLYAMDPDALEYAQSKHPQTEDNPYDGHTAFDLPAYVKRDSDLFNALADYQLGDLLGMSDVVFTAVVGHAAVVNDVLFDFDVSAADLVRVKADFLYDQQTLELRFNGRSTMPWGEDLEFVAGVFGMQSAMDTVVDVSVGEDITDFALTPAGAEALGFPDSGDGATNPLGALLNAVAIPGPDFMDGVHSVFVQKAESYSLFGQATWFLNPQWAVIAGLRYGTESKDANLTVAPYGPGITGMVVSADDFNEDLQRREKELSPKIGARYEWTDSVSSYLTWTQGYKSGGFNAISFQNQNLEFEPERADAFELGMKSRWLDDALAVNASVYHTRVSNMQVVNFNGVGFEVYNAAEAQLQGVEIDMKWLPPWPWLTIDAALGLSKAEYLSYPNAPAPAGEGDENEQQDLTGRTLPKAPVSSLSLRPAVSLPLWGDLGVQFGVDWSYHGDQYLELDLDEKARQKGYSLMSARIIVGPQDGRWGVVLSGDNLANTKALNFVADHNLYANSYFANQIPQRSASLSVSATW